MEWEIYLLCNTLGMVVLGLIFLVHLIGNDKRQENTISYINVDDLQ